MKRLISVFTSSAMSFSGCSASPLPYYHWYECFSDFSFYPQNFEIFFHLLQACVCVCGGGEVRRLGKSGIVLSMYRICIRLFVNILQS
jgi:hypothetical protein